MVNVGEGIFFEEDFDALVLLVFAVGAEEPAIDFLASGAAVVDDLLVGGVGVLAQIVCGPDFERVDAGQVCLVGKIEAAGCVGLVEVC